ncbi:hypothetical protein GQ53DRAFT_672620 [Thozetella sp. PMI_491]|nr:hypothetical protein GQ53DRAFT_672620 [Thozetella sp. PMI_491]
MPPASRSPQAAPQDGDQTEFDVIPPFFNTTFSTHRVSPLHVGDGLDEDRLEAVSRQLREVLIGGAVRGVEVRSGLDERALGRTGALEDVVLHWATLDSLLGIETGSERSRRARVQNAMAGRRRALHISLTYEQGQCSGILVPRFSEQDDQGGEEDGKHRHFTLDPAQDPEWPDRPARDSSRFLNLPLLLLRMPPALKTVVIDFLSTTFDCRVSTLHLGTRSLVQCWETWARLAGLPSRGALAKDVMLTLGFHLPPDESSAAPSKGEKVTTDQAVGLKSIDITIPSSDLAKFLDAGKSLSSQAPVTSAASGTKRALSWQGVPEKRRKLAGRMHEEGWGWRKNSKGEAADGAALDQPFTEALGAYINQHLALDLFHPAVRIVKIACGGFVLADGRLKVLGVDVEGDDDDDAGVPQRHRAIWELLSNIVEKAGAGVS